MKRLMVGLLLALGSLAGAQTTVPGGGGGSSSSTITAGTSATSGCTDGGFLYSLSSLIQCGANALNDGSVITLGGVAGSGENVVITNGTSTRNILVLRDNVTPVWTVADGGITTKTQPLRGEDGAVGTPVYSFTSDIDTGLWWRTPGAIEIASNGVHTASFNNSGGLTMGSARQIGWSNIAAASNAPDSGFARQAAGVVACTNGSTAIRCLLGGGTAVASATAMPLPTGRVFHVTGTTTITSITSTNFASGAIITLIFDGVLTFTDGSNLVLAGNFVTTADDTITLAFDGTNWYETSRSVN